jgi:ArsR family transcriptional regulator, arsenate/arsenite/antimonite-responsive transcriptional repressor
MATTTATPVDVIFRALSDRTRLRILHLLRGGERCVCDLVDVLGVPQPKTSRHLAYLRRAGLVLARKQGLWSYYRLASAKTKFHAKLLDCLACGSEDVPELANDSRRMAARGNRSCC